VTDKERIIRAFGKLNMKVTGGVKAASDKNAAPINKGVILICGSDISLSEAYGVLRDMKSESWVFTVVLSRSAEQLLSIENIQSSLMPRQICLESEGVSVLEIMDTMDALIIPNLTQNTLAKTAMGIQDELTSTLMWQTLVMKKPLVANTDSVFKGWFDIDNNKRMKKVMEDHVKALGGFGAVLVSGHDYMSVLSGRMPGRSKDAGSLSGKVLLTENDIKALTDVKELMISKGQILTPLGRDAAISKGIRIVYQRQ
jgi:hypothetical protein